MAKEECQGPAEIKDEDSENEEVEGSKNREVRIVVYSYSKLELVELKW